jgi:hypothetical protein
MEKNNNRVIGGRKGRMEGYDKEDYFVKLFKENKLLAKKILELKYDLKISIDNNDQIKIKKILDKKAADILIKYKNYFVGLDSKKSKGSTSTQWMRKRTYMFMENCDSYEKKLFQNYFEYLKDSNGKLLKDNKKSIRYNFNFTKNDEEMFFNYINNNKEMMIKKRWDPNIENWCDFLLIYKNNLIKIVSVDDLLDKEITLKKMTLKKKNYHFGEYITFKPYGGKQEDLQFMINKKVFDSKYEYQLNLKIFSNFFC